MTNPYSHEFFGWMRAESLASARVVVPMLLEIAPIRSVVDVGCGDGTWLSVFQSEGITEFLGVDGFDVAETQLQIPLSSFIRRDLSRPLQLERTFDLAIALEVAEHLPEERAPSFVRELTSLAPIVAFSAAIPGQGGNNHLNEKFQDYWAEIFAAENYVPFDFVRARLWNDPAVSFWYAQNLIVYCSKQSFASLHLDAVRIVPPLALVHPRLHARSIAPVSVRQSLRLLTSALPRAVAARLRRLMRTS